MDEKEKIRLRKRMKLLTINVHSWLEENQEEKWKYWQKLLQKKIRCGRIAGGKSANKVKTCIGRHERR